MDVEAGDVLHGAGAALDQAAVAGGDLHLDDGVAEHPDAQLPGRRDAGRDRAADRRVIGSVDRPLLAVRLQLGARSPTRVPARTTTSISAGS